LLKYTSAKAFGDTAPNWRLFWRRFEDKIFTFPHNGSEIHLAGADISAESLRGTRADLVLIDETGFINDLLYRYCQTEKITFTRSRPYRKNDQAHVEQKNWSVVRRLIGYDRFETQDELRILSTIYEDLRLYVNFFQPVLKLIEKEQIDGRIVKRYDPATTPFRRVLASKKVSIEVKARLTGLYFQLNPVTLRQRIDDHVAKLWNLLR